MVAQHEGADLLVLGGDVITMDGDRRILAGAGVAVAGGTIVEVGAADRLRTAHPGAEVLDASGCLVTPGFVNAHQHHTGDPLVRSCIPDDLAPGASIFEWVVPVHAEHTPDDDEVSATLTALNCLRNGITTVVEAGTVAHPGRVVDGMLAAGVRGTIGTWGWDVEEGPFAAPVDEVLDRQRAVLERWPVGGRVEGWVSLVGHDLASDELLAGAADLARQAGTHWTMHLSPTRSDPEQYLARHGRRPVVHLDALGALGPELLIAHGVWFDDAEVDLVLDREVAVASTPWAYLRLGQGYTQASRHIELVQRGGRVALGCDACNAADHHDLLAVAALTAGLAKDVAVDPTRFGAHEALELATIAGAAAIGWAERVGSIEPGKVADLVVIDAGGLDWAPGGGDPVLALVWGQMGRWIRDVVVAGEVVLADGRSTRVDEAALAAESRDRQRALLARVGLELPTRWPHLTPD